MLLQITLISIVVLSTSHVCIGKVPSFSSMIPNLKQLSLLKQSVNVGGNKTITFKSLGSKTCLDSLSECTENEFKNILNGLSYNVLNESVKTVVKYRDALRLIPEVLELEYLEEEDEILTKKVVNKCCQLHYPKRVSASTPIVRQCGLELLDEIVILSESYSNKLGKVESNIYQVINKTRSKKEVAERDFSEVKQDLNEAQIIRDKFDLRSLTLELNTLEKMCSQSNRKSSHFNLPFQGFRWLNETLQAITNHNEQTRRSSLNTDINNKYHEANYIWLIPFYGWARCDDLLNQIRHLKSIVSNIERRIPEIRRDIGYHHHYSSLFDQLEPKFEELKTRLAKIDGQLGLSEEFDNALTDQRAYWRMVSLSYKEIKTKATEAIDDINGEDKIFNLKPDVKAMYDEVEALTEYIGELTGPDQRQDPSTIDEELYGDDYICEFKSVSQTVQAATENEDYLYSYD